MNDKENLNIDTIKDRDDVIGMRKNKKDSGNTFSVLEVGIIILCTCVISIIFGIAVGHNNDNSYSEPLNELISNYQYIVNSYYGEVDEEKLVDAAINGIVTELGDTYSSYFEEKPYEKVL